MKSDNGRLITVILPAGAGHELLEKIVTQKQLTTVFLHHARGTGLSGVLKRKGLAQQIEKDMVVVAAPVESHEDIIGFIYEEAKIGRPHGGLMYVEKLSAIRGGVEVQVPGFSKNGDKWE